jgi:hypothetical protein
VAKACPTAPPPRLEHRRGRGVAAWRERLHGHPCLPLLLAGTSCMRTQEDTGTPASLSSLPAGALRLVTPRLQAVACRGVLLSSCTLGKKREETPRRARERYLA